ncbi:MAG: NADH-quinone oxidoreductase subunit C [Candidatus Hodarchaeaceae archaeon]|nr:NADH-quinone oxidoreductase subunit C [Candidatus Hodarchaeaceae archaeon]
MDSKEVSELIKEYAGDVRIVNNRCLFATSDKQRFRALLRALRVAGVTHISTITGIDVGNVVEVIYHFDCWPTMLNLKIPLPKDDLKIPTITDVFPGAVLYERDLMEMLGVKVEGHPDPRRLFLPDDWPEGVYPLRKEFRGAPK